MSNKAHMKKLEEEIHIDEEIFGLRNLVDIENRFKQYSNHYSSKGGTETLYNINIPSPKDNSPKTHEGSIWDDHFSHRHHDKILTRNMKRSYTRSPTGWRMQDDREHLFKEFGISYAIVSKFDNEEQQRKYIIDCIKKSIKEDILELNQRAHLKPKEEENYYPGKKEMERYRGDIFKWLKVRTKFEGLKKKLRSKLVELITDFENHGQVEKDLDEIKKSRESSLQNSTIKLNINGVPEVKTSEILKDVLGSDQAIYKVSKAAHRRSHSTTSLRGSYNASVQSTAPSITLKNYDEFNEEKQIDSAMKDSFKWNVEKEHNFVEHRDDAKSRLYDKINASSFNEVGFSPMVQSSQLVEKRHLQRENKLAKYMNGDPLTSEEYKFLAITSKSLNACVDKKFIQAAVNYLDHEIIETIETDLAQKILHEYQRVKDEIRDARMEYLKEETKVKIERVQSLDARYKRNRHVERGINDQQKVKKKLINFIEDQERKLEMTKRSDEMSSAKTDIQHFANKFMQPIKEKIHNRRIVAGENLLRRLVHTPTANSFDVKLSKHEYHPPSKLVLPKDKHTRDLLGLGFGVNDPLINKRPSESTKALKLSLNSPIFYKNPKNFAKFYSGGPQETEKDIFGVILDEIFNPEEHYKHISHDQEKALIGLQSLWRGFKERETFKQLRNRKSERQRTAERMEFLKIKSESPFMRLVLQAKEKLGSLNSLTNLDNNTKVIKAHPNGKGIEIKHIKSNSHGGHNIVIPGDKDSSWLPTPLGSPNRYKLTGGMFKPTIDKIVSPSNMSLDEIPDLKRPTTGKSISTLKDFQNIRPQTASNKIGKNIALSAQKKMDKHTATPSPQKGGESTESSKKKFFSGLLLKQRKLISAAKNNNFELIPQSGFTYYEGDVNIRDEKNNTPLYYAAKCGNREFCEFLLGTGARINDICNEGNTALHMAFESGNHLVVMLLIQSGANMNILNDYGQTPIAFGSENLLSILDLKNAVATYDKGHARGVLPEGYDNSKFLKKTVKSNRDKGGIFFNFDPIHNAGDALGQRNGPVKAFVRQGERVTID